MAAEPLTTIQAVNALLALLTGLVYGYVGSRLSRRKVEGDGRLAWTLFTHWWYGLAALTSVSALLSVLPRLGLLDPAFYLSVTHVLLVGLCYLFFCLLYYLAYLFTGRKAVLAPIAAFYVAYYVLILYYVNASGMYFDEQRGRIDYANRIRGPLLATIIALLVGPHLVGAALYFRLFFKVEEPTQRYRIGLVAGTIIAWFSSTFLSYVPLGDATLGEADWWPLVTRAIGLAAALLFLAAYLPPAWVRERYGILPVEEVPRRAR